jgi:molybdenum cofactor biosynthesis enzyme MoaA
MEAVVTRQQMLQRLGEHYGPIAPVEEEASAPATRFRLADGTIFGIISSTTEPFCRSCDRSRLTADGVWLLCLYAIQGTDLRGPLRRGASEDARDAQRGKVPGVRASTDRTVFSARTLQLKRKARKGRKENPAVSRGFWNHPV